MSESNPVLNEILAVLKSIDERINRLEQGSTPNLCSTEKKPRRSSNFQKGLKFSEVRALVLSLRKQGLTFNQITAAVNIKWAGNPEKHVTRAAIHRFWDNARSGRLKEFGIDINL